MAVAALAAAFYARVWSVAGPGVDDAGLRDLLSALDIARNGTPYAVGPIVLPFTFHLGPLYYYFLALPFLVSSSSAVVAVWFVGWQTLTAAALFRTARRMLTPAAAFALVLLFLASDAAHAAYSRLTHSNYALLLAILALGALWDFARGRDRAFVSAVLWVALGVQVHLTLAVLAPVLLGVAFVARRDVRPRHALAAVLVLLATLLPSLGAPALAPVRDAANPLAALVELLRLNTALVPVVVGVLTAAMTRRVTTTRWRWAVLAVLAAWGVWMGLVAHAEGPGFTLRLFNFEWRPLAADAREVAFRTGGLAAVRALAWDGLPSFLGSSAVARGAFWGVVLAGLVHAVRLARRRATPLVWTARLALLTFAVALPATAAVVHGAGAFARYLAVPLLACLLLFALGVRSLTLALTLTGTRPRTAIAFLAGAGAAALILVAPLDAWTAAERPLSFADTIAVHDGLSGRLGLDAAAQDRRVHGLVAPGVPFAEGGASPQVFLLQLTAADSAPPPPTGVHVRLAPGPGPGLRLPGTDLRALPYVAALRTDAAEVRSAPRTRAATPSVPFRHVGWSAYSPAFAPRLAVSNATLDLTEVPLVLRVPRSALPEPAEVRVIALPSEAGACRVSLRAEAPVPESPPPNADEHRFVLPAPSATTSVELSVAGCVLGYLDVYEATRP